MTNTFGSSLKDRPKGVGRSGGETVYMESPYRVCFSVREALHQNLS